MKMLDHWIQVSSDVLLWSSQTIQFSFLMPVKLTFYSEKAGELSTGERENYIRTLKKVHTTLFLLPLANIFKEYFCGNSISTD